MNVLECYGVAVVAEDKATDTDEVLVYLSSLYPEADGEVVATAEKKDVTIKSPTGDTRSSSALSSNAVMMKWLPFNTNRVTAPDVRKGSKVVVYKFKGQSTYRWMYFGMDGTLRLETVIYAFSATPHVKEDAPLTPDNYYIFLISSHTKKIQLLTGMGNGEPCSYSITLDTGNGGFSLIDSEENSFVLNSMKHFWSFSNQEKSIFAIDRKKIVASCEDEFLLQAKNHVGIKTNVLNIDCQTLNINASSSTTLTSPTITINGDITHTGDTAQTGTFTNTGGVNSAGAMSASGDISSEGDVKAGGISLNSHHHTEQGDGAATSGPQ